MGGDIRAGIRAAVGEVVESYELYSLNFVLGELGHIWVFRYPEHNPLHMLRRGPGGDADGAVDHADSAGTMRLHYEDGDTPMVVVASEPISEEPGWEEIASGELIHIGPDLVVDRETIVAGPPEHPMLLNHRAAKSQSYA